MTELERLVVSARLRAGAQERAEELLRGGPPFEPALHGLGFHAVFACDDEVVFLFAGSEVERIVADLMNDPIRSASFAAWAPLLDGPPRLLTERYVWSLVPARA